VGASYTTSNTRYENVFAGIGTLGNEQVDSSIASFDAKVDGNAFSIPAGDVRSPWGPVPPRKLRHPGSARAD